MKVFLVGGAVRDKLLKIKPKDNDYVVVGSTIDEMLSLGFTKVGSSFPVFIHPETKEEYALARKDSSIGLGHKDFETEFGKDITLKDDLFRRDLTINSIAYDNENDEFIDYFGGISDINNKLLRPTSKYFSQDPLRYLRIARFSAQLNFKIVNYFIEHTKLNKLNIGKAISTLPKERIFIELEKALMSNNPENFFNSLKSMELLDFIFPELYKLIGAEQPLEYHPEGDAYNHTMECLKFVKSENDPILCFGALCHDLGKGLTPKSLYPKHYGHDVAGLEAVYNLCNRLGVPRVYKNFAIKSCRYHMKFHKIMSMRPKKILDLIKDLKILKNDGYKIRFFKLINADLAGKIGDTKKNEVIFNFVNECINELNKINYKKLIEDYPDSFLNVFESFQVSTIRNLVNKYKELK